MRVLSWGCVSEELKGECSVQSSVTCPQSPPRLHRFLLPSLTLALDLAVPGTAWVTDETENSLDVEWENPPTEVDYYRLQYGPLTGHEVAEVTVPKSGDPKSQYDITGKSQHWGCEMLGVDAEVGTV